MNEEVRIKKTIYLALVGIIWNFNIGTLVVSISSFGGEHINILNIPNVLKLTLSTSCFLYISSVVANVLAFKGPVEKKRLLTPIERSSYSMVNSTDTVVLTEREKHLLLDNRSIGSSSQCTTFTAVTSTTTACYYYYYL